MVPLLHRVSFGDMDLRRRHGPLSVCRTAICDALPWRRPPERDDGLRLPFLAQESVAAPQVEIPLELRREALLTAAIRQVLEAEPALTKRGEIQAVGNENRRDRLGAGVFCDQLKDLVESAAGKPENCHQDYRPRGAR
jgi:hypothetical protein